jgi:hypothetical protein
MYRGMACRSSQSRNTIPGYHACIAEWHAAAPSPGIPFRGTMHVSRNGIPQLQIPEYHSGVPCMYRGMACRSSKSRNTIQGYHACIAEWYSGVPCMYRGMAFRSSKSRNTIPGYHACIAEWHAAAPSPGIPFRGTMHVSRNGMPQLQVPEYHSGVPCMYRGMAFRSSKSRNTIQGYHVCISEWYSAAPSPGIPFRGTMHVSRNGMPQLQVPEYHSGVPCMYRGMVCRSSKSRHTIPGYHACIAEWYAAAPSPGIPFRGTMHVLRNGIPQLQIPEYHSGVPCIAEWHSAAPSVCLSDTSSRPMNKRFNQEPG